MKNLERDVVEEIQIWWETRQGLRENQNVGESKLPQQQDNDCTC